VSHAPSYLTKCYRIELLSYANIPWADNYLTIRSLDGTVIYKGTNPTGSVTSDNVCLANGCYFLNCGGGNPTIWGSMYWAISDSTQIIYGTSPTQGIMGFWHGSLHRGRCTSHPSVSTVPTLSRNPTTIPSTSMVPSLTIVPTSSSAPTPNRCITSCFGLTCNDMLMMYPTQDCMGLTLGLGCSCGYCACPTNAPIASPTFSLRPTRSVNPTRKPSRKQFFVPTSVPLQLDAILGKDEGTASITTVIIVLVITSVLVVGFAVAIIRSHVLKHKSKSSESQVMESVAAVSEPLYDKGEKIMKTKPHLVDHNSEIIELVYI